MSTEKHQYCIWRNTTLGAGKTTNDLAQYIKEKMSGIVYTETVREIRTANGLHTDLLFAIDPECIPKFAVQRLGWRISWLEDVINIDPDRYDDPSVLDLYSWEDPDSNTDEDE